MSTHYIPYFTIERSLAYNPSGRPFRRLQAVCGTFIDLADHTVEPTCPACQTWLTQDVIDAREADRCDRPLSPSSTAAKEPSNV
jgi:hypothetical protein